MTGRLRFSNAEACIAAAEAGLGIARAPSFIAGARFRTGSVRRLPQTVEAASLGLYALYPSGRHLAFKVRVLADFLAACHRGEPAWDQGW